MDRMKLERMEFFAYHGVFPEENRLGQSFLVDVELGLDLSAAGHSDALELTVNYAEAYERIRDIVERRTFRLIEALAESIASDLLHHYTDIQELTVRVTKLRPPFRAQLAGVSVEIRRKRETP